MTVLHFDDIRSAIIESLSPDLLEKKYAALLGPDDPRETGHCAVASEAFYHLAGGKAAGFVPTVCSYAVQEDGSMAFGADKIKLLQQGARRETHWWVRGPKAGKAGAGKIYDVTAGQYPAAYPYAQGHNTGFMQPQRKPSKRAQLVIDRVTEKLGAKSLEVYKTVQIAAFAAQQDASPRRVNKTPRCSNS